MCFVGTLPEKIIIFWAGLVLSSCTADLTQAPLEVTGDVVLPEQEVIEIIISTAQYQRAAASASILLTNIRATPERLAMISDQPTYESFLNELLDSSEFINSAMVSYHKSLFDLGSLEADSSDNEPAYLGAYIVEQNRPYSEILTANYCVERRNESNDFIRVDDCNMDSNRPPVQAGVLSVPALLKKDAGAQNIRRAARTSSRFLCIDYPDGQDQGRSASEISPRYGGTMFGYEEQFMDGKPCSSCHSTLTDRSMVFRFFDDDGVFQSSRSILDVEEGFLYDPITGEEGAQGETHRLPAFYKGQQIDSLADLGQEISKDSRFSRCATQGFYNWIFAKERLSEVPSSNLTFFSNVFEENNKNVKKLIFSILSHKKVFLERF